MVSVPDRFVQHCRFDSRWRSRAALQQAHEPVEHLLSACAVDFHTADVTEDACGHPGVCLVDGHPVAVYRSVDDRYHCSGFRCAVYGDAVRYRFFKPPDR